MKKKNRKKSSVQNPIAVAMVLRYSRTTCGHKHATEGRGGNRNKQRDYLSDNY